MTFPTLVVEFAPTFGPFDTTPTWISLSDDGPHGNRVLAAEWSDGRQQDLSEWPPGQATIVLDNHDRLFDPDHTAGTYYGDLLPRVPFRIRATHPEPLMWDGDILTWDADPLFWEDHGYDLFYGFVEDGWEQNLKPPKDATCTVRLVDMLAVLSGHTLRSAYYHEVMADTPKAYWPLDESDGNVMGDRSGTGVHGLYDNAELGQDPLVIDAAGKSMFVAHVGDNRGQYKGEGLPTAVPVTLEAWVKFDRDLTAWRSIVIAQRDNAFGSGLWLHVAPSSSGSPNGEVVIEFRGLGAFHKSRGSTRIDDGQPHHIVMTAATAAQTDILLYVDGQLETQTLLFGGNGGTWRGHRIWVVGNVAASSAFDFGLEGLVDEVAVYNTALSPARIEAHHNAGANGLAGMRSDEQIAWILDAIGVPAALYDLAVGESLMGPSRMSGRDALELIREITTTEQGAFYVDHTNGGVLRFDSRFHAFTETRSTIPQATFTDDPAATDLYTRVERDQLEIEPNGVRTVINQATVSWWGGTEITDESAGSPYGPRPVSIDTQAINSSMARGIGQWIVNLNSTPQARIRSLGINPGATGDFTVALNTRIRDRVTYRSHPQTVGSALSKQLEVQGRSHTVVNGVSWTTRFYLIAAPGDGVDLFTLGTSELGGSHILAY